MGDRKKDEYWLREKMWLGWGMGLGGSETELTASVLKKGQNYTKY